MGRGVQVLCPSLHQHRQIYSDCCSVGSAAHPVCAELSWQDMADFHLLANCDVKVTAMQSWAPGFPVHLPPWPLIDDDDDEGDSKVFHYLLLFSYLTEGNTEVSILCVGVLPWRVLA